MEINGKSIVSTGLVILISVLLGLGLGALLFDAPVQQSAAVTYFGQLRVGDLNAEAIEATVFTATTFVSTTAEVDVTGNASVGGDLAVTGDLDVTGNTTFTGTVTGDLTGDVTGTLTGDIVGPTTVTGLLTVTDEIQFGADELYPLGVGLPGFQLGGGRTTITGTTTFTSATGIPWTGQCTLAAFSTEYAFCTLALEQVIAGTSTVTVTVYDITGTQATDPVLINWLLIGQPSP